MRAKDRISTRKEKESEISQHFDNVLLPFFQEIDKEKERIQISDTLEFPFDRETLFVSSGRYRTQEKKEKKIDKKEKK